MSTLKNHANPYLRNKVRKRFGFDYAFIDKEELKALREEEARLNKERSPSKDGTDCKEKDLINPNRVVKPSTKVAQAGGVTASGRVVNPTARVNKSVQTNSTIPQCRHSVNQTIQPLKHWRRVDMNRFSCLSMSSEIKKYLKTRYRINSSHVTYSRSFGWEVVCGLQTVIIIRCDVFDITSTDGNSSIFLYIEGDYRISEPYIQNALARVRNEYPNSFSYYQIKY